MSNHAGILRINAYPLDVSATLSQSDHTIVGDVFASRNVKALETFTMLSNGHNRSLSYHLVVGNVESQKRTAVFNEGNQSRIGETFAVGQSQALDTGANSQGQYAAIVDLVRESGEVQPLDEVAVTEEGMLETKGLANAAVVLPVGAGWAMPE